jgi:hypothetical protein
MKGHQSPIVPLYYTWFRFASTQLVKKGILKLDHTGFRFGIAGIGDLILPAFLLN